MIFKCTNAGTKSAVHVEAPTWFDARRYAIQHFACDPSQLEAVQVPGWPEVDVELRWVGTDAHRHGGRQLEMREKKDGQWTEWASFNKAAA
jgi:hypothetical protein